MRPKRDIAGRSGQPGTGTKAGEKAAAEQEKTNARKIAPQIDLRTDREHLSTKRSKREIRAMMHEFWRAAESGPGEKAEGGEGTKGIIAADGHEGGTKREEEAEKAERTERVESKEKKNQTEGIQKEGGHKEGKQKEVPDCLVQSGQVHQKMPVMAAANPIASGKAEALLHLAIDLTWCRPGEIGGIESSVRNLLSGMTALSEEAGPWQAILLVTKKNGAAFRHLTRDPRFQLLTVPGEYRSAARRILSLNRHRRRIRKALIRAAQGETAAQKPQDEDSQNAMAKGSTARGNTVQEQQESPSLGSCPCSPRRQKSRIMETRKGQPGSMDSLYSSDGSREWETIAKEGIARPNPAEPAQDCLSRSVRTRGENRYRSQGQSRTQNKGQSQGQSRKQNKGQKKESVVLLEPCGYHAMFLPCPGISSVTVIHDLQPLDLPENFSLAKRLGRRLLLANTFRHADGIIAVSDFTKKRILRYAPYTGGRLTRIYDPIAVEDPCEGEIHDREEEERILSRYGLESGQYYFTVSSLLPHKNLATMIDTFAILKSKKQSGIQEVLPCRLVIAGITQDPTRKNRKELQKKIDKEQLTSCITLTERISDQERDCLYRHCRAFLFPSLYEGFGMPCVEARLQGAIVIASFCTAIPEAAGEGAVYVTNPKDPRAHLAAMEMAERGRQEGKYSEQEQEQKEAADWTAKKGRDGTAKDELQERPDLEAGTAVGNPFEKRKIAAQYLAFLRGTASSRP